MCYDVEISRRDNSVIGEFKEDINKVSGRQINQKFTQEKERAKAHLVAVLTVALCWPLIQKTCKFWFDHECDIR